MENKPDLIVVRGGGAPDAYASIAVANVVYAAAKDNREVTLQRMQNNSKRGGTAYTQYFVDSPTLLPYPEAQSHFRYVFGYNNSRSTQVIMQEAAKSNHIFFFGYCLIDSEMELLLEVNPNVYVFDYHTNTLSQRVRNRLSMYKHDVNKCAAQLAWDFFVPSSIDRYPMLINEVAFSIFNNRQHGRELFFGLTSCPFQAPSWVSLLGVDIRQAIPAILQRGQFFLDFHKVLQSQILDSATIVRFEGVDHRANQKQVLSKAESSSDALVIYMLQCTTPTANYFMRCIDDLRIAKRSIVITYSHHIRECVYHYTVASNCGLDAQVVLGYDQDDANSIALNGAYLYGQGCFTSGVKPPMLLNHVVDVVSKLIDDEE